MQLPFASLVAAQKKKKVSLLIGINIRVASLFGLGYIVSLATGGININVWGVIFIMTVFSFSGSYANIAYTDIMGRVIKADLRKKLLINKQLISSIGLILSSVIVKYILSNIAYPQNYSLLFYLAAALLLAGTIGFWLIDEGEESELDSEKKRPKLKQFIGILKDDKNFRQYLILLNSSGVIISTLPFLLLFGKNHFEIDASMTGTFLLIQMGGSLITTVLLRFLSKNQKYKFLIYFFIFVSSLIPIIAIIAANNLFLFALVFLLGGVSFSLSEILFAGILLEISNDGNRAIYTGLSGFGSVMQVIYPLVFATAVTYLGYNVVFILTTFYILLGLPAAHNLRCNRLEVTYL